MLRRPDESALTVLFGAFDRHNLGDLLFPHVVAKMLPEHEIAFAGLASRDLRGFGGHSVTCIDDLVSSLGTRPVNLIHAGGELLTCNAWEAFVMLSSPADVRAAIDSEAEWRRTPAVWARTRSWPQRRIPYVVSSASFATARVNRVVFNAVGGVGIDALPPDQRSEVVAALGLADVVSVRDTQTQSKLRESGVEALLFPDPVVMVADLFGDVIRDRARHGEVAEYLSTFPRGYLTLQFDASFADDVTIDAIARKIDHVATRHGLGVVLFRAGAAPWHDDIECYARALPRIQRASARIMNGLDIWDICALIAHSRGYCGTSLHGRVVAAAFSIPRVNFFDPARGAQYGKQRAFASTWEPAESAFVVGIEAIAEAMSKALTVGAVGLARTATELAARYRDGFGRVRAGLHQRRDV